MIFARDMMLLDWFAGQALASPGQVGSTDSEEAAACKWCYDVAETMMVQRANRTPPAESELFGEVVEVCRSMGDILSRVIDNSKPATADWRRLLTAHVLVCDVLTKVAKQRQSTTTTTTVVTKPCGAVGHGGGCKCNS